MNVQLSRELETFVQSEIESGHYASANEVVQEALRLLEERDRFFNVHREELRQAITEGAEALGRGEGVDGEAAFDRLEARLDGLEKGRTAG